MVVDIRISTFYRGLFYFDNRITRLGLNPIGTVAFIAVARRTRTTHHLLNNAVKITFKWPNTGNLQ